MRRFKWLVPFLYIVFLMLPIYWLLNMSFKTTNEILGSFTLWPRHFTFDNYAIIFTDPTWYWGYINSIAYVTINTVISVTVALPAAYAFSRYRFRGHRALMIAILAITGVPLLTNLLALYQMGITLRKAQLPFYDDRFFLAVVYLGFFLPLSVWIAKGFFDAIPRELDEAALIDGCSPLGALVRIVMPLAVPGLMAIFLLTFVGVWNEFIAGYLLIAKNEFKPVMFGLYDFLSQNIINFQVISAACVMIALPVVILFIFARRIFFQAMLEGAVKG